MSSGPFFHEAAVNPMHSGFESLSIRARIALGVAVVMLPMLAFLAWLVWKEVSLVHDAAHEKVRMLASGTAADLRRALDQFESALAHAAVRPAVKALDPLRCDRLAVEYVRVSPAVVGLEVRDAQGRTICPGGDHVAAAAMGPAAASLDSSAEDNALAVRSYMQARTQGKFAIFSYPVRGEDETTEGWLLLAVDLLVLNDRLLNATPPGAVVTVLDRQRTILLRSLEPARFIGSRPTAAQDSGTPWPLPRNRLVAGTGRDGIPRLLASATVPGVGWEVVAGLPRDAVLAEYRGTVLRTVAIGAALCLLALMLGWRMSATVANPIAHLEKTAASIASGNRSVRARIAGPPEIKAVARQFNHMLDAQALGEARFRGIFETTVDAIVTADEDWRIVQANPAAAAMFRCKPEQVVGAPLDRFVPAWPRGHQGHEADGDEAPSQLQREAVALRWDGKAFAVEASVSRAAVAGSPMYTVILRDISQRKQAEQDLQASASKLQAALASMGDAICIADGEGNVIEYNEAFAAFHGYARAACGSSLVEHLEAMDMFAPDGSRAPPSQRPLAMALRGESATNVEYRIYQNDTGASRIGSYSFAPIRSGGGRTAGAIVTTRDVTAIREVQADLESSHLALQQLVATREQVQEEERKRIARDLHDDLQQTLAAIRMDLQVAAMSVDKAIDLLPLLAGIDRRAEQAIASARRIVNDLRPPMLEDLGLTPALEAMAVQYARQTGIECTFEAGAGLDDRSFDQPVALCVFRAAQEALNNVAKHSHASAVHLRLAVEGGAVSLQVRDNGCGIAMADRRKSGSFGLLGIRERVRACNGTLRIDGSPGEGTVLELSIPLAEAPPVAGARNAPA